MKKLILGLVAVVALTSRASAHDTTTPFPTRGACEAASAQMSNGEKDFLLTFTQFFSSPGEVSSFLTRAWTCDRNPSDGQYYITDHVEEILGSDWFEQRNH